MRKPYSGGLLGTHQGVAVDLVQPVKELDFLANELADSAVVSGLCAGDNFRDLGLENIEVGIVRLAEFGLDELPQPLDQIQIRAV